MIKKLSAIALLAFASLSTQANEDVNFGLGLGIPYGLIGANAELGLHENFAVSAGVGIGFEEPAFAFGAHAILPTESGFNPRISFYYSTAVAAIEYCDYSDCEFEQFAGTAFGAGFVYKHFIMEFLVGESPEYDDRIDELNPDEYDEQKNGIALAIAYRF